METKESLFMKMLNIEKKISMQSFGTYDRTSWNAPFVSSIDTQNCHEIVSAGELSGTFFSKKLLIADW